MKTKKYNLIALTFLAITNSSYAQICFVQTDTIAAGAIPFSVISSDFNNDGKADLAIARSNYALILLGTGTGSFGNPSYFAVGTQPNSIISTDFNGDGKIDLATANLGSNNISVLLGDGLGSFGSAINYSTYNDTQSLCSADFNGDGKIDLVVATNNPPSSISVLFGNGAGSFSSSTNLSLGFMGGAATVISADFNNDGKADVASVDGGSYQMSTLIGNGTGSFSLTNYSASNTLSSIISADFNADNFIDLASVINNQVAIYINNGSGSFAPVIYFTATPSSTIHAVSLCSADFDKDGKLDIATANYPNTISLLAGTGTGSFAAPITYTLSSDTVYPHSIISADFNGDSAPDIATADVYSHVVSVFLSCTTMGIEQFANGEQIQVYPNPANDLLNVELKILNETTEIKIIDLLGNQVISTKQKQIDVSNLQSGVYFVNVKTGEGVASKKIIIQR